MSKWSLEGYARAETSRDRRSRPGWGQGCKEFTLRGQEGVGEARPER